MSAEGRSRLFGGLVGTAMFLGFGAVLANFVLDRLAFPSKPISTTVAEAAANGNPARGAWVRLVDARMPCRWPALPSSTGDNRYRLATGPGGGERIVIAREAELACSDGPTQLAGVLRSTSPGRIVGLEFPDAPWSAWPTPYQITLWMDMGPDDSLVGLLIMPPFVLLGLFVAVSYLFAPTGKWFAVGFLVTSGLMMIVLPLAPLLLDPPSGGWILRGFLLALGALLLVLAVARARREPPNNPEIS